MDTINLRMLDLKLNKLSLNSINLQNNSSFTLRNSDFNALSISLISCSKSHVYQTRIYFLCTKSNFTKVFKLHTSTVRYISLNHED